MRDWTDIDAPQIPQPVLVYWILAIAIPETRSEELGSSRGAMEASSEILGL